MGMEDDPEAIVILLNFLFNSVFSLRDIVNSNRLASCNIACCMDAKSLMQRCSFFEGLMIHRGILSL